MEIHNNRGGGVETQYFASPRSRIEPNPNPNPCPETQNIASLRYRIEPESTRVHASNPTQTRYRIEPEPNPTRTQSKIPHDKRL
jgi:hypothetical protein